MSSRTYGNMMQVGIAAVMIFTPLARGTVRLWSTTPVEVVIFSLLFMWLWRVNNTGDRRLRRTELDLPILLFGILAAFSCVFSIHKHASILEVFRMVAVAGVFYLVVNNFSRHTILRFATVVVIMGSGMSLFGLGQYFAGLNHSWWVPQDFLASTYVNHNHFAGYLEMAIPLAVGMLVGLKRHQLSSDFHLLCCRAGLVAALSVMLAALTFSQSRGAWVCLLVSLIVMNIVLVKRRALRKESLFIFLSVIAVAVAYISAGDDPVAQRLRTAQQLYEEGSTETRRKIWQGSIDMIRDNPAIGTGIGTFVWGFPAYRREPLGVMGDYAHNDYLHMMAEMGVLALPLMLWVILLTTAKGFRGHGAKSLDRRDSPSLTDGIVSGSAVGILSLALHALVDFNFHITANMLTCSLLAGFIMRSEE